MREHHRFFLWFKSVIKKLYVHRWTQMNANKKIKNLKASFANNACLPMKTNILVILSEVEGSFCQY